MGDYLAEQRMIEESKRKSMPPTLKDCCNHPDRIREPDRHDNLSGVGFYCRYCQKLQRQDVYNFVETIHYYNNSKTKLEEELG